MTRNVHIPLALLALLGVVFVFAAFFVGHGSHATCLFAQGADCPTVSIGALGNALHHITSAGVFTGGLASSLLLVLVAALVTASTQPQDPLATLFRLKRASGETPTYTQTLLFWVSLLNKRTTHPALVRNT